jgi:hypothetical protein
MSTNRNLFKKYINPVFIETGSYLGNGIQEAVDANFQKIYSIELSDKYFNICKERFKNNKNIHLIKGDSTEQLFNLINSIDENITFWLDGHYSAGDTALGKTMSPLMTELDIIKRHKLNTHTIIIDDLRCWKISPEYNFCVDDIIKFLYKINSNYKLIYEDGFIKNDILVAKI